MKSNKQQNAEEYILMQLEKERAFTFKPEINENSLKITVTNYFVSALLIPLRHHRHQQARRHDAGETTEDYLIKLG